MPSINSLKNVTLRRNISKPVKLSILIIIGFTLIPIISGYVAYDKGLCSLSHIIKIVLIFSTIITVIVTFYLFES